MSSVDKKEEKTLIAALHGDEHQKAKDELVKRFLPLVQSIARKYAVNADSLDDLTQVGSIGLIKAIERFDPMRGVAISTYATPTIIGEIKRYFRDHGHLVRPTRGLYELVPRLERARQALTNKGHKPTIVELAEFAGVSVKEAEAALGMQLGTLSFDADSIKDEDNSRTLGEIIGKEDGAFAQTEAIVTLELMTSSAALSERELKLLYLRFYEDLTQTEIAKKMGISQMHVSRLIRRAFAKMNGNVSAQGAKKQTPEDIRDMVLGLSETERALAQEALGALKEIGGQASTDSIVGVLRSRGISKEALLFALTAKQIQFDNSGIWKTTSPAIIIPSIQEIIGVNMSLVDRMLITLLNHGQKAERRILRETVRNQDGPLSIPKNAKFASLLYYGSKRGMIEIEGGKDSSLITPLVKLDDVMKKYRGKMLKQKEQEERERLSRPVITDPRFEQLLSQPLSNVAALMAILLQYGTRGTTYQNLRGLFGKAKADQAKHFSRIVQNASTSHNRFRKPVIERVKAYKLKHDMIKPLIGLDELIEVCSRTKPKQPRKERRLTKPIDYDPLIDELARIPLLNRQEKILLVLWKFGHEGTDRWTLREMIKQEDETLRLSGHQLSVALWLAEHPKNQSGVLVEIDDTFIPDDQIIRPVMTLHELSEKYCFGEQ